MELPGIGDGYGYVYGDGYVYGYSGDDALALPPKGSASAWAEVAQARLAEKPGRFWELYGSTEDEDGAIGNVILALNVLGSFNFYSFAADVGSRAVGVVTGEVRNMQ